MSRVVATATDQMVGTMQWYSRQPDLVRVARQLRKLQVNGREERVEAVVRVQWQVNLRLGAADKTALVEGYRNGIPTTRLCTEYHVSKDTVLRILAQAGVQMRRQPMTSEQVAEAGRLYASGLSLSQVSERMRIHQDTIRLALLRTGMMLRPSGGSATGRKVR